MARLAWNLKIWKMYISEMDAWIGFTQQPYWYSLISKCRFYRCYWLGLYTPSQPMWWRVEQLCFVYFPLVRAALSVETCFNIALDDPGLTPSGHKHELYIFFQLPVASNYNLSSNFINSQNSLCFIPLSRCFGICNSFV